MRLPLTKVAVLTNSPIGVEAEARNPFEKYGALKAVLDWQLLVGQAPRP